MYNYIVTAHKPSSVYDAVKGNFTAPTETNLILNKSTRIEIWTLTPEGLKKVIEAPIHGKISVIQIYKPKNRDTDLLFVATESFNFCVLSFDPTRRRIITEAYGDLHERVGRPAEKGQFGVIDPMCRMIGLHWYQGLFKVIPMETGVAVKRKLVVRSAAIVRKSPPEIGTLKEAFDLRLEELQIISMTFLYGFPSPVLAILYFDGQDNRHIKTYNINLLDRDWHEAGFKIDNVSKSVELIIAVPRGGLVYFEEEQIVYYDLHWSRRTLLLKRTTPVKTASFIEENATETKFLVGDNYGQLSLLVIPHSGEMDFELLGKVSFPKCIVYLDNGYVFIGSHFGDSQLIHLTPDYNSGSGYIKIVENYLNLAPISDLIVVDLDKQGQGQIITCSGGFEDGTLRIIRNGVGIAEQAVLEMHGIRGVWALRPSFDSLYDEILVITFINETRVLTMTEGEEMQEVESFACFAMDKMTLATGNMMQNMLVQVTEASVRYINQDESKLVTEWNPPDNSKITVASVNPSQVVIALGGGVIVYFEVKDGQLVETSKTKLDYDIACLTIHPLRETKTTLSNTSSVLAVGLWTDNSVRILSLPSLSLVTREHLGNETIPRSVLLVTLGKMHYLLVALGDGTLYNFVFHKSDSRLTDRKKFSLGTQPIALSTFMTNGSSYVFCASDRPTVIYANDKKLMYSNVNVKEVNFMCPFNSASFPNSLVITSEDGLKIGSIDEIQKLHIKTLRLNEMPRRIAYQESSHTFGILTMGIIGLGLEPQHHLRLMDDKTFGILDSFTFDVYEMVESITSLKFSSAEDAPEYYAIGTGYAPPDEEHPRKGRILIFCVENKTEKFDRGLRCVAIETVNGTVPSLLGFNDMLLASINSTVALFSFTPPNDSTSQGALTKLTTHSGYTLALYLATRGDFIVVGDMIKSFSLLIYKHDEKKFEEIAKDYNSNWLTAVETIDDEEFIGGDASGHVITVRTNNDAPDEEDRARLEEEGGIHFGDMVNKFKHGSLAMHLPEGEPPAIPMLVFGSLSGAIGVVASLTEEKFKYLQKLEDCIRRTTPTIGNLRQKDWRRCEMDRRTFEYKNFIDGDLIESFIDCTRKQQNAIAAEMGASVEELGKFVDELTRIH